MDGEPLSVRRGSPFTAEFAAYDDDAQQQPSDLTGWRAVFQVRTRAGAGGAPLLEADSAAGDGTVAVQPDDEAEPPAPRLGIIRVYVPGSRTLEATADDSAVWELVVVNPANPTDEIPLGAGPFALTERVAVPALVG